MWDIAQSEQASVRLCRSSLVQLESTFKAETKTGVNIVLG